MHMLTNSARLVPILFVINRLLRIFLYIQPIMHMCAAYTGVCAKHMHSLHTVFPVTSFLCTQDQPTPVGLYRTKTVYILCTHMCIIHASSIHCIFGTYLSASCTSTKPNSNRALWYIHRAYTRTHHRYLQHPCAYLVNSYLISNYPKFLLSFHTELVD